jgi:hypothetical protein
MAPYYNANDFDDSVSCYWLLRQWRTRAGTELKQCGEYAKRRHLALEVSVSLLDRAVSKGHKALARRRVEGEAA